MLASNRGRMFAITLKALPEDTQHDITGGTYRGPLAQEFRSCASLERDTLAGFSQNHIWLRGFAETVLALEEIRAGQVLDDAAVPLRPPLRNPAPVGARARGLIPIMAVGVPVGVVVGVTSPLFVVAEVAANGGMLLQDRLAMLFISGWARVGDDEKHVCAAGHGARPTRPSSDWSIGRRPA